MEPANSSVISKICDTLGARAHRPGSRLYEERRTVWNATVDRKPAVVVSCASALDVQTAVRLAVSCGLGVSVRGGGHNIAGSAVEDDVLMIDLGGMEDIIVDEASRVARIGGGATLSKIDFETQKSGLAVPAGVVSTTGIGGLALGGGIGWLARRHGLSIDNLISAEVVLADGQIIVASETEHPDLFWALRGGGGNFGVVTEFEFRLHAIGPEVSFGPTFFALKDAQTVLSAYAHNAEGLSRDACVWANLMTAPPAPVLPDHWHGQKVLALMQFHSGNLSQAEADFAPLYGGALPIGSALAKRSFVEAQSFLDPTYEFGARNYWRTHNLKKLTPGLIADLVDLANDLPTEESELLICQLGGAVENTAPDATAFAHRRIPFVLTPGARWRDPVEDDRCMNWLDLASERIAVHAVPGAYVNFIADDGNAAQAYAQNLNRLREVKHRYDPNNLFRVNQNIAPAPPPE